MVNEPAEFDDEATVTEIAGYNTPYWDVGNLLILGSYS